MLPLTPTEPQRAQDTADNLDGTVGFRGGVPDFLAVLPAKPVSIC
jgi:hypothetical protein